MCWISAITANSPSWRVVKTEIRLFSKSKQGKKNWFKNAPLHYANNTLFYHTVVNIKNSLVQKIMPKHFDVYLSICFFFNTSMYLLLIQKFKFQIFTKVSLISRNVLMLLLDWLVSFDFYFFKIKVLQSCLKLLK